MNELKNIPALPEGMAELLEQIPVPPCLWKPLTRWRERISAFLPQIGASFLPRELMLPESGKVF